MIKPFFLAFLLCQVESKFDAFLDKNLFDTFVDCASISLQESNGFSSIPLQCGNVSSQSSNSESVTCFEELGKHLMIENGCKFYRGICECKSIDSTPNHQFACATGAYNSWMSRGVVFNDKYSTGILYPCSYAIEFPAACYRTFWTYNYNSTPMRDASLQCLAINDKNHRHSCIHGVGYAYSSKYASDTGLLFPIDMMCSVGNTADKIMCIHGYWDGIKQTQTNLMSMKSRNCQSFKDRLLTDACMFRSVLDVPHDSPLFQPASTPYISATTPVAKSTNETQASALLLYRVNQSQLNEFRTLLLHHGQNLPLSIATKYFPVLGINAMIYSVETAGARCNLTICHLPGHTLGRAVFMRTQNFEAAIYVCGKGCLNGCFHGALRQWYTTLYHSLDVNTAESALRPYYARLEKSTAYHIFSDDVFHALGHAILESIAGYSYRRGLDQCAYMPSQKFQYRCSMGIWMEYFRNNFTDSGLSPCDYPDVDFPASCYYLLWPEKHLPSLETAQSMCLGLQHSFDRHGCFHGMGFAYSKEIYRVYKTLPLAEICSQGDFSDRKMCIYAGVNRPGPFGTNATLLATMCGPFGEEGLHQACMSRGFDKMSDANFPLFYYTAEMRRADAAVDARNVKAGRA